MPTPEQRNRTPNHERRKRRPTVNPAESRENRGEERLRAVQVLLIFLAAIAALPDRIWTGLRHSVRQARTVRRESREGKFPESNSPLLQLFLLLPGLFPMWRATLREVFLRRRGKRLRVGGHRVRSPQRRGLRPLAFAAAALALGCAAVLFSLYTPATTVFYNGEPLETVRSAAEAHKIAERVEGLTAQVLGDADVLNQMSIQFSNGIVRRSELGETDALEKELTDEIGLVTYGYSLYINDELVGSTEYEGALEALLDQIRQISVSEDTLSVDFVENVRVTEGYVPTESITNLGYIAETINSTKSGEVTYTVQSGDTWSKIAASNNMSVEELSAINAGYDINKILIGDELVLSREVPYLTVRVVDRQNYVDEVNYDIVYVDDSSMYQGDTRVIDPGVYGTADIVADVEYINGVETQRTILSEVMLTSPKAETRARGTKERPSWLPTGSFRWPASGRLTSGFGYRNTGIRGASTNHMGIDIACAYGSPIYAADGGTVEYTGYKGAMGYTVIINHGNGYKTYYEHCSSFACKTGQHVYKGQKIAYVGRSGVASGAHCHFGIQKNGTYVNPMKYLR